MSEQDGSPPPAEPTPEGDAAPRRRSWFRRRTPRPQPENVAAETAQAAAPTDSPDVPAIAPPPTTAVTSSEPPAAPADSRPVFRPLEAPPLPEPSVEASRPAESPPVEPAESPATRAPRRRRPAARAEAGVREPEFSADTAAERAATEAPAPPQSATPSPVEVNVVIPRGMARRVNSKLIQQVTRLALQREGWDQPASLDVVIVSDDEMREINATRRGIDEATDVLSFPMLELRPEAGLAEDFFVLPPDTQVHLGDVVISFARVESQAEEAGHSQERELAFLTVHAVLHILGYDHDTEEKRRRMRRREEDVLVELGLRRNGN